MDDRPELHYIPRRPSRSRNRRGKARRAASPHAFDTPRLKRALIADSATADSIRFAGLDPALGNLGLMIGLLSREGDDSYELDPDWFGDPIGKVQSGLRQNPAEIAGLLTQLLGSAAGQAMGLPVKDAALLGTWYPLITPDPEAARGLYIVNYQVGEDQVFGIGVLGQFNEPAADPAITIEAWGLVPVMRMGASGIAPVLSEKGFPVSLGVAVEGVADDKGARAPLFDLEGISFDGAKANVLIDLSDPSVSANIVALRLKLPGDTAATDRSLADLAGLTSIQIQETVAALFVGALSQLSKDAADEARYLLPVIGVSGRVPGSETVLPELDWGQLLARAIEGGDVARPFADWFTTLTGDAAFLAGWLGSIGGAMGARTAPSGAGSRVDPMAVTLAAIDGIGTLDFTIAAQIQKDGNRHVWPGLRFGADPVALGSSDAVLRVAARAELAEFIIGKSDFSFGAPSSLDFSLGLALTDKDPTKPLAEANGYSAGSVRLGVALSAATLPLPQMQLVDLVTPDGSHDTVNLLSPSELAREAEKVLPGLILSQLKKMLGIGTPDALPFADGIAALIGVTAPAVKGGAWPKDLLPPFSGDRIGASIRDPLTAIGDYYRNVLTRADNVNGRKAFSYVVEEIAGLLQQAQSGTVKVAITGEGTPQSPWSAALTVGDTALPAHLTAFTAPAMQAGQQVTRLVIGISLAPQLELAGTRIEPNVTFDLVSVDLPDAGSQARLSGLWAPLIAAGLRLPDGFTSPQFGGATLSIGPSEAMGAWSREDGLSLRLLVSDPVLSIDGQKIALGQSLDLSDPAALRKLVEDEVAAFRDMLVGLLGVALLKTGTRQGLALAGAMGLLPQPDKAAGFPKGLNWPAVAPLTLESFTDPWPALRKRIAAAVADDATAGAILSLVGWALDGSLTKAPQLAGSLSRDDPFRLPLMDAVCDLLVSAPVPGASVGLGLGRRLAAEFKVAGTTLACLTDLRLDVLEFDLDRGVLIRDGIAPGIGFQTRLSGKSGPLVDGGSAGQLGALTLGMRICATAAGTASVQPILTLHDVTLPGEKPQTLDFARITASDFAPRALAAVEALVGQGIDATGRAAAKNALFAEGYALLAALGLAAARTGDTDPYGINPDGWRGLVADPAAFCTGAFETLLADPEARARLLAFAGDMLGIKLPEIDSAILEVLAALGLLAPADLGYAPCLERIVALIRNPVAELVSLAGALIADSDAVAALLSQLSALLARDPDAGALSRLLPAVTGPLTLSLTAGQVITLAIDAEKAPQLAGILSLAGSITLDLTTPALSVDLGGRIMQLGLGPQVAIGFHPATGAATVQPDFTFGLGFGDGIRPGPDPLVLFGTGTAVPALVDQLSRILPDYALSTLGTLLIESQVLATSPLAQQVFSGLGLAQQVNGVWRMPSLLGLARDPRGWLLSKGVLGKDGQFDVAGFARWLGNLPEVKGPAGLAVAPVKGGVGITGLPYGFGISLTGARDRASIAITAAGIDIADGSATLEDLSLGVTLGGSAVPGISGALRIAADPGVIDPIFADIGYDNGFALTIGQGQPTGTGLRAAAAPGLALQLLPFEGFGSLVEQTARQLPAVVLKEALPPLLDGLRKAGARDFADALQLAAKDLDVSGLVSAISGAKPLTLETVETAALDWLKSRLDDKGAPKTASAVVALLKPLLGQAVSASGGMLRYRPTDKLPLTFEAGVDGTGDAAQIGLWASLDLPDLGRIRPRIQRGGIGIPRTGTPVPKFSFGAEVTVAFEGDTGPQLSLALTDSGTALPGLALCFDPLGPAGGGKPSDLSRQLLPEFFPAAKGNDGDLTRRVEDWLMRAMTEVVPRYVAAVLLNRDTVADWLGKPLFGKAGGPSPADVLIGTRVLTHADDRYGLADIAVLKAIEPEVFAGDFIRGLLAKELRVLSFGPGDKGALWIGPNPADKTAYGLRVLAPGLKVPKLDFVTLQLGAEDAAWIAAAGGPDKLEPGVGLYLPIPDVSGKPKPEFTRFELNLVNLGLDFTGKAGRPLVDFSRFKMGGVSPRAFVDLKLNGASTPDVAWGVGAGLDDIAISVTPSTVTGDGGNAVAKNLLGAGEDKAEAKPADPAFTAFAAYAGKPFVTLTRDGKPANPIIIPIQRSFGPLNVVDVGFGWEQDKARLDLLFDGGLALAGLSAQVQGLSVGIPVKQITDPGAYALDLQGLDLSFKGGSVVIEGGLEKFDGPPIAYQGALVVQAAGFGLTALGAYSLLPVTEDTKGPTAPSLFAFGALKAPLGGVPAFFVTGVAAGFGVNRRVIVPPVSKVQDFPLLPGRFGADMSLSDAMAKLADVVKPQLGQYWLAAGLTFTSFELIDGVALLFVSFGRRFEIDLVGLASAALPKGLPKGRALAYVELALKATVIPDEGFISVEAQLTPNSYVLAEPCKLTGGFAFMLWLKDSATPDGTAISAGQFVLSLGGYHPAFKAPSYYPEVPRLGLDWLIDVSIGRVSISGGVYFALVPTAIMAGGYLKVLFEAGPLSAWLDAQANFIIQWKPFWFEVDIGVSVGVAFKTKIGSVSITLSVSLGADLILEGPPTHGKARVNWYIISFTIPIGKAVDAADNKLLDWDAFSEGFLPKGDAAPAHLMAMAAATDARPAAPLKLAVAAGRLGGANEAGDAPWLLRAVPFALRADTVIPAASVRFDATGTVLDGAEVGIRPMGEKKVKAPMLIRVRDASGKPVDLDARGVSLRAINGGAPNALWSSAPLDTTRAPSGDNLMLEGAVLGAMLEAASYVITGQIPEFPLLALKYDLAKHPVHLPLADPAVHGPARPMDQTASLTRLKQTIMAPDTVQRRNAACAAFRAADLEAADDAALSVMADAADQIMQAPPVLASPALYQAPKPVKTRRVPRAGAPAAAPVVNAPIHAPRLESVLRLHAVAAATSAAHPALPAHGLRAIGQMAPAGTLDHALLPGHSGLWRLDPRAPHTVGFDGGGMMRALCLDADEAMLADRSVSADGSDWSLPAGTRTLLLQPGDQADVAGWQLDSPLFQTTSHLAIGHNCTLRIQNAVPLPARKPGRAVEAEDLLAANEVTGAGGRSRRGWVQTILPGWTRRIAVITDLPPDQAADRLSLSAGRHAVPGIAATTPLAAVEITARAGGSVAHFDLPDDADPAGVVNIVTRINGADPAQLLSVQGFARDAAPGAAPMNALSAYASHDLRPIAIRIGAGADAPPLAPGADPMPKRERPTR